MRLKANEAGLERLFSALGIGVDDLLGEGGEAWVFALDEERIARVSRGATRDQVDGRTRLLAELGQSAHKVPFSIPAILDTHEIEGRVVTIERRLPGRPLDQLLTEKSGAAREALIRSYLETANRLGDLALPRPWFGDLGQTGGIRTRTSER